ncbi:MAG: efflux RND transporter periplasmic adaptor subunit [bacterium]
MKKKIIKIIIGISIIFLTGYFLHKSLSTHDIPKVSTVKIKKGTITASITASGRITAREKVDIMSKTEGLVEKVLVKEGARVKKGTCLVKFDKRDAESLYNQAKEKLNEAYIELNDSERELNRETELFKIGAVAETQLQRCKDRYNRASIRVRMAQEELAITQIRLQKLHCLSPIDGVIITENIKDNQFVPVGYLLFTIADTSSLEIEADVDELDAPEIKIVDKAIITSPIIKDTEILGVVQEIAPKATMTPEGAHTIVKVSIIPKNLPPALKVGNQVEVKIITHSKNTFYLPIDMVLEDKGGNFVFVYDKGRVLKKRITTGISNISYIEVFGLNNTDEIIRCQRIELKDKMRVIKINEYNN